MPLRELVDRILAEFPKEPIVLPDEVQPVNEPYVR